MLRWEASEVRAGGRSGHRAWHCLAVAWEGLSHVRNEWRAQADNGGGSLQDSGWGGKDRSREMQAAEL